MSVNGFLVLSFCPVATPYKGEADLLLMAAKSWYKKKSYFFYDKKKLELSNAHKSSINSTCQSNFNSLVKNIFTHNVTD